MILAGLAREVEIVWVAGEGSALQIFVEVFAVDNQSVESNMLADVVADNAMAHTDSGWCLVEKAAAISNADFVDWDFEDNATLLMIWLRV